MTFRATLIIAALAGLIAVIAGTFGAHGLADRVDDHLLEVFQTGNRYHAYHALALLGLAGHVERLGRTGTITVYCFAVGTFIFSGTLYLLAITGHRWLGAITPLGGITLIAGWISLGLGAWRSIPTASQSR